MTLEASYGKLLKEYRLCARRSQRGDALERGLYADVGLGEIIVNEVNAVDKYEYKLKTEQMLELMEDGAYKKAAAMADEIDWKRVRNVTMLTNVSDIYEKTEQYQKSYDVLNIACQRAVGSRKIISRLCVLALKLGKIRDAEKFYGDFVQTAPKDPNQYILKYQILRAKNAPIDKQIKLLEEYKKSEYIEEWAYELAKLYEEAGMTAECMEECDDLILWFSEGKYVYKAMELKMEHKPLTPSQQERYDHRFERPSISDTEEIPKLDIYIKQDSDKKDESEEKQEKEAQGSPEESEEENQEPPNREETENAEEERFTEETEDERIVPDEPKKKKIGDTMRLDEALRQLLHIEIPIEEDKVPKADSGVKEFIPTDDLETEDDVTVAEEPEEEDITDLEDAIGEIESVADLDMIEKINSGEIEPTEILRKSSVTSGMKEIKLEDNPEESEENEAGSAQDESTESDPSQVQEDGMAGEPENSEELKEELPEESEEEPEEKPEEELPEEPEEEPEEELPEEPEEEPEEELPEESGEEQEEELPEEPEEEPEEELPEESEEEPEEELLEESEEEPEEELPEEPEEEQEEKLPEEPEEEWILDLEDAEDLDLFFLLAEDAEDLDEEFFEEVEDFSETVVDAASEGEVMENNMEEDKKVKGSILPPDIQRMIDEIEGIIPPEESETIKDDTPVENMGKVTEELRIDDDIDLDDLDLIDELNQDTEEMIPLEDIDAYLDEEDRLGDGYFSKKMMPSQETEELEASEDLVEEEYFEEVEDLEEEEYFEEAEDLEEEEYFEEAEEFEEVYPEEEEYLEETEDLEEEEYLEEAEDLEEEEYLEDAEDLEEEEYLEEAEEFEEVYPEEEEEYSYFDDELEEDYFGDEEDYFDDEEFDKDNYFDADDDFMGGTPDFEEEFRLNPSDHEGPDDREIPDDDDDGMDILSATTPLSRKETAKLIATGKTAPLPLSEVTDALSMSDTGFIVHGRYDLETQSGIGTRAGLTEEQKKLFSYFVPVRGMSEQLVDVLEQDKNCTNRNGTSRTGNLLIIGNKGNGKTVLAVDVVKAIQKQRNIRQGKVAIVTGDSLNKKKISDIFSKLYGGALIIEKAGKMNEKTLARLNKAMEKDTGELLIVLEEQRKPLDRLLSSNREFRRKFTSRLEVPIFINDELVTFGQTYAQENGYRIDEMGILALYSRIDSLQREDHAVTVAEVKDIMDEAITHSQKASAKKLMKRVFGKSTDDSDRILLSEKDFNI